MAVSNCVNISYRYFEIRTPPSPPNPRNPIGRHVLWLYIGYKALVCKL